MRVVFGSLILAVAASPAFGASASTHTISLGHKGDAVSVLPRLREKLSAVKTFVAEYSPDAGESDGATIHVSYEAPDRARLEMRSEGGGFRAWLLNGMMTVLIAAPGKQRLTAHFDMGELFARERESTFDEVLLKEFPKSKEVSHSGDASLSIQLSISKSGSGVDFKLLLDSKRGPALAWLTQAESWLVSSKLDASQVVFNLDGGQELAVSRETGFIERITVIGPDGNPRSMRLVKLSLDEPMPEQEFALVRTDPEAKDISDDYVQQLTEQLHASRRLRAFSSALEGVATSSQFEGDVSQRLGRVLAAHYEEDVRLRAGLWKVKAEEAIQGFAQWLARSREKAHDDKQRTSLEQSTTKWRLELEERLVKGAQSYVEGLQPVWGKELDGKLAADCLALDQLVARTAYDQEISAAVLKQFDEAVQKH
jgi:hypothetical protein